MFNGPRVGDTVERLFKCENLARGSSNADEANEARAAAKRLRKRIDERMAAYKRAVRLRERRRT